MVVSDQLQALGFCGADDSVNPALLAMISHSYPLVEFGVLFHPDMAGQPRYATDSWVEKKLAPIVQQVKFPMKLAAHLCGTRVNDILDGTCDKFLEQIIQWGFRRVQINATAVNGVDTSKLLTSIPSVTRIVDQFQTLEFIVQKNDETKPLWEGLQNHFTDSVWPKNLSMLFDESKGTGLESKEWPVVDDSTTTTSTPYEIGYAGGIGPNNIRQVLPIISQAASGRNFWIDMESSLRSIKNGKDVFDIEKCFQVIDIACDLGFVARPDYLQH